LGWLQNSYPYFIFELKNYKKTKVGTHEVDSSVSQEKLQKIIQEELERLKDEIENLKSDL